ncbi:small basic family protein [Anaerotignum sp.]|uniref:small basic family protein n=1 Tax=Anaerotignum sp. TaxID=2039241 RepID=UPI00332A97D8
MIAPIVGVFFGVLIGVASGIEIPYGYSGYVAMAILACLDSVLGGIYAILQKQFDIKVFATGFFCNGVLAVGLVWLGNQLNMDLSIAAVVVFGSRIFNNFSQIRRFLLNKTEKQIIVVTEKEE